MAYFGYWGKYDCEDVGSLTISGANTVVWAPGVPVDVKRLVFVVTTATTVATSLLTVGKRNVDDTSSVVHDTYTFPIAAINGVYEALLGEPDTAAATGLDGSEVHTAAPLLLEIEPGEELFITSDGGATAGVVECYVQYQRQGATGSRWAAVKLARP
jgi:hypothetical protein